MTRRHAVTFGTVLCVLLYVAACSEHPTPPPGLTGEVLRQPGTQGPVEYGVTHMDQPDGQAYTVGSPALCVQDGEAVSIQSVTPIEPNNLELASFATYPVGEFGSSRSTLEEAGLDPTQRTVTSACPGNATGLALQVSRTQPGKSGHANGFHIRYTVISDGRLETMTLPFQLVLCPPESDVSEKDVSKECLHSGDTGGSS